MYGILVPVEENYRCIIFKIESDKTLCLLECVYDVIKDIKSMSGTVFLVDDVEKVIKLVIDVNKDRYSCFDYWYMSNLLMFIYNKYFRFGFNDKKSILITFRYLIDNKTYRYDFVKLNNAWYEMFITDYLSTDTDKYEKVNKDLLRKSIYEFVEKGD